MLRNYSNQIYPKFDICTTFILFVSTKKKNLYSLFQKYKICTVFRAKAKTFT